MMKHIHALKKYMFPYMNVRIMFRHIKNYGIKKPLIGCEVGVEYGINLRSIFRYIPIDKIYAIDIDLSKNKYFNKKIVFIEEDSLKAVNQIPDNSLDFCYIDSSHKYKDTFEEIHAYFPKVKIGGVLGGHDFNNKCVSKAVFDCFNYDDIVDGEDWHIVKNNKSMLTKKGNK